MFWRKKEKEEPSLELATAKLLYSEEGQAAIKLEATQYERDLADEVASIIESIYTCARAGKQSLTWLPANAAIYNKRFVKGTDVKNMLIDRGFKCDSIDPENILYIWGWAE
jgi:hypothetical protein